MSQSAFRYGLAVLIVFVLLFLSSLPCPAEEGEGAKAYNMVLRSAVLIFSEVEDGGALGSGALIDRDKRMVLTAHHVVAGSVGTVCVFAKFDAKGKVISDLKEYRKDKGFKATKLVSYNQKNDLAVLQLAALPSKAEVLPLAKESPSPGDRVYSIGNPGVAVSLGGMWVYTPGEVRQVIHNSTWPSADHNGQVTEHQGNVILATSPVNSGDSGGPLFNGKGELVGVAHATSHAANATSIFIDQSEVRKFLGRASVNYKVGREAQAAEAAKGESPSSDTAVSNNTPSAGDTKTSDAKPAETKAANPKLAENESKATGKLRIAKSLIDKGFGDDAKVKLQDLIEKYPDTKAANEAKDLLDRIKRN